MKKKVFFLSIMLIFMFLTGCAKNYNSLSICNEFISAVVEIQVRDDNEKIVGNATGTMFNSKGGILTNRHVIRSFDFESKSYIYHKNFYIRHYNEEEYTKATLESFSDVSDLALLKMEKETKKFFRIGKSEDLKYGDEIHTIGNGNGYGLAYTKGNIAAPLRYVKYENDTIEAIQLSLIINEGNSGGPLMNSKGELVGITTFRLRDGQNNIIYGTSFALPTKAILDFLSI